MQKKLLFVVICMFFSVHQITTAISFEHLEAGEFLIAGQNCAEKEADCFAYHYIETHPSARLFFVYPHIVGHQKWDAIQKIFSDHGTIVYQKDIKIHNLGGWWYLQHVYYDNAHFGVNGSDMDHIRRKAALVFGQDFQRASNVRVFLVSLNQTDYLFAQHCKSRIRKLFPGTKKHAVHSDHKYTSAVRFAQGLYHQNTLQFFNSRKKYVLAFERLLDRFEQFLSESNISVDQCCIVGKAVWAALGEQDVDCIKFVMLDKQQKVQETNEVCNISKKYSGRIRRTMILNSKNYFYYRGFKFFMSKKIRSYMNACQ